MARTNGSDCGRPTLTPAAVRLAATQAWLKVLLSAVRCDRLDARDYGVARLIAGGYTVKDRCAAFGFETADVLMSLQRLLSANDQSLTELIEAGDLAAGPCD